MGILFRKLAKRAAEKPMRCTAVVPAAGSSRRMGEDKLFLPLGGVPVLVRTLRVLETCPEICEIIVVTRRDRIVAVGQMCHDAALSKVHKVVAGGETRAESVLAGIREVNRKAEWIAIHDAARPLVTEDVVFRTMQAARACGAAAPAVPVKDTVKRAVKGVVQETLDRAELYAVQTPQIFEHGLIQGALEKAVKEKSNLTDDCSAVEQLGMQVMLTEGSYENLKITTPDDLAAAEAILARRKAE